MPSIKADWKCYRSSQTTNCSKRLEINFDNIKMKISLLGLAVLLLAACTVQAFRSDRFGFPGRPQPSPTFPQPPWTTPPFNPNARVPWRFRRSPQGSISGSVLKSEHNPPQLSVDYNHRIINDGRTNLGAYGGVATPDFKHFTPHAGVNYEWTPNKDTFLRANGGIQQGPFGRITPNVGATFGMRFRRDAEEEFELDEE